MAAPFDALAQALLDAVEAGNVEGVADVLASLEPDVLTQLRQSLTLLGRWDGLLILDGPPANTAGAPGAIAIAIDPVTKAKTFYGPKDAMTGWPAGEPFLKGDQGDEGPQGPQGETGETGPKGDTGDTGPKGDTGAQGVQGLKGDTGAQGPKGDIGEQGIQGVQGPKGDTGAKGDQGIQGIQGPKGDKGDRGEAFAVNAQGTLAGRAAYDSQPVGFAYLDDQNGNLYFRIAGGGWSPPIPFGKGEKGDQGEQGPQGVAGPKGDDGDQGPQGIQGVQGPKGDKGDQGPAGSDATVPFATVAEVRAGVASGKALDPKALSDADAFVAVAASGAFALDFAAGRNFIVTLSAASTMNAPSSMKDGQSGTIYFVQDATGGRTLGLATAIKKFGTYTLSTAANAVDRSGYVVRNGVLELTALEKGLG